MFKDKLLVAFFPVSLVVVVLSALVRRAGPRPRPSGATVRARIVDEARKVDGLSAGADPEAFGRALGVPPAGGWGPLIARPFAIEERPDGSLSTSGVSTCALVAREILRRAGLELASLDQPYVPGSAMREILELASARGALHAGDGYAPQLGDLVVLGIGAGDHVATVVELEGDRLVTVDGGLLADDGLQRIGHVSRLLSQARVAFVVDVSRLPWRSESAATS